MISAVSTWRALPPRTENGSSVDRRQAAIAYRLRPDRTVDRQPRSSSGERPSEELKRKDWEKSCEFFKVPTGPGLGFKISEAKIRAQGIPMEEAIRTGA